MTKEEKISRIQRIIQEWGGFSVGEVMDADSSPTVSSMGGLVALAEHFSDDVEVCVYDSNSSNCNPIKEYSLSYEELSEDTLDEILILAEYWEVDHEKTFKRCQD
jgi:hypothetical protein